MIRETIQKVKKALKRSKSEQPVDSNITAAVSLPETEAREKPVREHEYRPRVILDYTAAGQFSTFNLRNVSEFEAFHVKLDDVALPQGTLRFINWLPFLGPHSNRFVDAKALMTDGEVLERPSQLFKKELTPEAPIRLAKTTLRYRDAGEGQWTVAVTISYTLGIGSFQVLCEPPVLQ